MRLGALLCGSLIPFACWNRMTRFMSSTRSLPEYLSTTLPSARNTNEGTDETPKLLAICADSSFLSMASLAHRVNPDGVPREAQHGGEDVEAPRGGVLSMPTSTMASCLSQGTSMPASKPAAAGCAIEHEPMKSSSSELVEISET